MQKIPESALYQGLEVDLLFEGAGPEFGDLFTICGYENPSFPPSGKFDFVKFRELLFSQVDDYFGVRTLSGEGDDVAVWLSPLIGTEEVYHNPGPFDGLRLSYNVLRHPIDRSEHFLRIIEELRNGLPVTMIYRSNSGGLDQISKDICAIAAYWDGKGIRVGSDKALLIDY